MAQTIALQRGTTTVTPNGSDVATLFTQSGGTATRVILNQLGISFSYSPTSSDAVHMTLIHEVSGGHDFVLGIFKLYSGSAKSIQFPSGASSTNSFVGMPYLTSTSNSAGRSSIPVIYSEGTDGVANQSPSTIKIEWPTGTQENRFSMLCSNFYIGPSDSLSMRCSSSNSGTGTISYSFTTITES